MYVRSTANRNINGMALHFCTLLLSCLSLEFFLYKSVLHATTYTGFAFWAIACIASSIATFPLIFVCLSGLAYIGSAAVPV